MTTLADLAIGDQVLFAFEVTAIDPTNGVSMNLYGPSASLAASGVISPTGALTGQLANPANQTPVTKVTGFAPIAVGDVLQDGDGNTYVAMWSQIQPDGSTLWAYDAQATVKLPGTGYTNVGHVNL